MVLVSNYLLNMIKKYEKNMINLKTINKQQRQQNGTGVIRQDFNNSKQKQK